MSYKIISYSTKAGKADENQRLIADVFRELHETQPDGVRYAVLRLEDGTFMHIVSNATEGTPLTSLASFEAFQDRIEDRQAAPALRRMVTVVGNYGVLK